MQMILIDYYKIPILQHIMQKRKYFINLEIQNGYSKYTFDKTKSVAKCIISDENPIRD